MGFQKFQKAESIRPVTDEERKEIKSVLSKTGKVSAADLTDEERRDLPK